MIARTLHIQRAQKLRFSVAAAAIPSFTLPLDMSEYQLFGLGIIALTIIGALLMVWKLPMRRDSKGTEWGMPVSYPNRPEALPKPSLEGNFDVSGDNPSSNGHRSEHVSVGAQARTLHIMP